MTVLTVEISCARPSRAKNSHWMGTISESAAQRPFKVISPSEGGQSSKIKSNSSLTGAIAVFNFDSRLSISTSSSSAPARSMLEGMTETLSNSVLIIASLAGQPPISTLYDDFTSSRLLMPKPLVELPCGSISMSRVLYPFAPSAAVRLTAVVVLPTPPFWLTIATVFAKIISPAVFFMG